jgi:hypothetical protein
MKDDISLFVGIILAIVWFTISFIFIVDGFNAPIARFLFIGVPLTILWFKYGMPNVFKEK